MRRLTLLGPPEVDVDGERVALRDREHALLAAIALGRPNSVGAATLISSIWLTPPATAAKSLQNHVVRIRRSLGADAILTEGSAYRLGPDWTCDLDEFDRHRSRAELAHRIGDASAVRAHLAQALTLVRGDPLPSLEPTTLVSRERARLQEAIELTGELHLMATVDTGHLDEAAQLGAQLLSTNPSRERLWLIQAVALGRLGERRAAIDVLQCGRRHLRDESGLSVGHASTRLESLLLADDPAVASTPLEVLVDAGRPVAGFATAGEQFFVGRSAELEAVDRVLAIARQRSASATIHVQGPMGSGRTTFARRATILARADGWLAVRGSCRATAVRPLEPFGDLLAQAAQLGANVLDPGLRTRLHRLTAMYEPAIERSGAMSLADDVIEIVGAIAALRPTFLAIDDADQMQPSTARVLRRMDALAVPLVTMLVGHGPFDVSSSHPAVHLSGLTNAETRQVHRLLTGRELDVDAAEQLRQVTNGSPPQIRQAVLETTGRPNEERRTDPVGRAAQAVVARLDHELLSLCVALAIASTPVDRQPLVDTLARFDLSDPVGTVREAVARGLVGEGEPGGLQLTTEALRLAVLAAAPPDLRLALHEAWWAALESTGGSPFLVAHHAVATADVQPERALESLARASRTAEANGMFEEAADYESAAADLLARGRGPTAEDVLAHRVRRCDLLRLSGDPRGVAELWEVADTALRAEHLSTATRAAGVLCSLGPTTQSGSLDARVAQLIEHTLPECDDVAVRARASAQASLFYSMSDYERSRQHFATALADARTCDDDTLAFVLGFAYTALTDPDDWPLRHDLGYELLGLAERLDDDLHRFEALHLLFSTQLQRGDPLIRTTHAAMMHLTIRLRASTSRWMADYLGAALLHLSGRLDESLLVAQRCRDDAPVSASRATATYLVQHLAVRFTQGRAAEMADVVGAVADDQVLVPAWRAFEAWPAACRGDWDGVERACRLTADGTALARDIGWMGGVFLLARAVAARGDQQRIEVVRGLLEPYTGLMTWVGHCTFGPVDLALAELAAAARDREAAHKYVTRARQVCTRLHAPAFTADLDRVAAGLTSA